MHNTEPTCLPAAHEVASLISGSRWRVSKREAQSGSMYVISKRMTLAVSQPQFSYKKHTVSILFRMSFCTFFPLTNIQTALLLKIPICSVTAGANMHFSNLSFNLKSHFKSLSDAQKLLQSPSRQAM